MIAPLFNPPTRAHPNSARAKPRLLLIGACEVGLDRIVGLLRVENFALDSAPRRISTAADLGELGDGDALRNFDLVVTDNLPDADAMAIVERFHSGGHDLPVIVLSNDIEEDQALALMRAGARDCLRKNQFPRLGVVIRREWRSAEAVSRLRDEQEAGRLLELACRLSPSPIAIADARAHDRPLVYINAAFESLTGYASADVLGRNCRFLQGTDRDQEELTVIREALRRGERCEATLRNYRKDGSLFYNHLTMSPLHDDRGAVSHFVAVQTDVTELKRLEARSRQALEQAHVSRQCHFVAMVSHEFRTPLGVINTAAHLLGRHSDQMDGEERAGQIHEIQGAVGRMTLMMEDLLVHGELETGNRECQRARLDVAVLCRQVISGLSNDPAAPALVACTISPAAREASVDGVILRRILENLLSNAVKYSDARPVQFEVTRVSGHGAPGREPTVPPEDHLHLLVSDQGIGIPPADLAKLFGSFHRAANVGDRPGTGMGLAIVKQCVDLHRGTLRVESTVGEGTTVRVWLPIAASNPPAATPQPSDL